MNFYFKFNVKFKMSLKTISDNFIKFIKDEVMKLKTSRKIPEENIEVEVRYGTYNGTHFTSGIDRRNFIQLKTFLENLFGTELTKIEKEKNKATSISSASTNIIEKKEIFKYTHSIDRVYRESDATNSPGPSGSSEKKSSNRLNERYTTVYKDGLPISQFRTIKQSISNYEIPDYLMRVGISLEQTDNNPEPKTAILWTREKKRYSLNVPNFRFDLTEVTSSSKKKDMPFETIYEVEIEMVPAKDLSKTNSELIEKLLKYAFSVYKDIIGASLLKIDKLLISQPQKFNIINRLNLYTGSNWQNSKVVDNTIITNARTVKARDLTIGSLIPKPIKKELTIIPNLASKIVESTNNAAVYYTMTIKADGVLKLLLIDETGVYFVGPPDNLIKIAETIPALKELFNSVFIGELVQKKSNSQTLFLIFDVLSIRGNYNIQKMVFEQRLAYIVNSFNIFKPVLNNFIDVAVKEFSLIQTVDQFYSEANRILDYSWDFLTDGLICTPYNFPYHTTLKPYNVFNRRLSEEPDILKIKKTDDLTIDFEIRREISETGEFQLYASNVSEGKKTSTKFVGTQQYPFNPLINLEIDDRIKKLATGTIIEFKWDYEKKKFVYVKTRDDKNLANGINIAIDVWKDIHNPIEEKTIRGQQFFLSFRYHNVVKTRIHEIMLLTVSPSSINLDTNHENKSRENKNKSVSVSVKKDFYLLSIGAGKGGDVYKWIAIGVTYVICVEPDEENRKELENRLKETSIKYKILPNFGQDVQEIVNAVTEFIPGGKVHFITYMLSLSFFFNNTNSIYSVLNLVDSLLLSKGAFGFLTIDGRYVLEYFQDPNNYELVDGGYKAKMKLITLIYKPKENGFSEIFIDIPDSKIVHNQTEYLTNIPQLIELFKYNGYQLIREERTNRETFMIPEELIYTSMFSYAVLQKTE